MSSVKEDIKDIENLKEVREELTDERNSRSDICVDSVNNIKKDSFDSYLSGSQPGAQNCNNKGQGSFDISKGCNQNTVIKPEENGAHSKTEKRRNVSLLKNEPPPLIHYLQDKEAPEIDEDNSPPQLLPEVIVTRTKLHREKSQTFTSQSENSFKVSIARNLQKCKRKLWMKYSSFSDDQTSNESHENIASYSDISQCSSTASGVLKKGTASTPEKQRRSKQSNCEKSQRMGVSPEAVRTLPKFPSYNGTSCFSSDGEPQERIVEKCRPASSESGVEEFERECSVDLRNEVDYESWLTETEDEEEDDAIFVVPPQISTGKEERDRIDGIEFLGFETEHDMVEFTKIELDYRGECQQNEENITHSDDGLDMMDDSFNYSESEANSGSQAIVPTKTKDITKIKGWRTKTFAINNNPSEGQCSSSSVGPYEDDDGFVSCDIKIEEDASLDMEEQEDIWSTGEQDSVTHEPHLPVESYTVESVKKEFPASIKTERKSMETDEIFSGFEDQTPNLKNDNVQFENRTYGTGRYPKRMSTTLNKVTSAIKKEVDHTPSKQTDLPYKVPKKRGRKPKTIAEKRLMLQLANQYKRRRKRGRPKGSGKKSNKLFKQQKDSNVSEVVYNLRNKSKREDHISDKSNGLNSSVEANNSVRNMEIVGKMYSEMEELNDKKIESIKCKINSKLQFGQRRYLLSTETNIQDEVEDSYTYFSSLKNSSEEKNGIIESSKKLLKQDVLINSNTTPISTTNTLTTSSTSTSLPVSRSSCSVSLINPSNKIKFTSDVPTNETSIATLASGSLSSTSNLIPSSSGAITTTTNSVAVTTAELPTISHGGEVNNWKNAYEKDKIKQSSPCNISVLDRSLDKSFEYGLILSTGIRRPLVTLAMDQLRTLRENNHHVDEHWAKFAASIVVTKTTKTPLQPSTVILPVRALRLPFMSFTPKPVLKDPYQPFGAITRPQSIVPKFDPMTGTSVRVRCPRPLTQVGVRTIPSIFKRQNLEHDYHILGIKRPRRSTMTDIEQRNQHVGSVPNNFLKFEIDDEIRKVVDDLVDYVERREARDLVIHEEPRSQSLASESSNINENIVLKRKKGPMIRELTRLDVNVIEMWDARNKKCTEEYCKLGCVCESLECCKPAIEQHCGKEECMFTCECEPKSYKRGDSRQHTLLSPLTLLTIPQQNRRILAKEEKEFQQTVIRAKHETIVVGSNGSSRRKREIKLPGRYRDSYVALGKDYGLVDFKISSDENIDPSARRLTRIAVVNNRELIQGIPPKSTSGVSKVPWEVKVEELKLQYGLKECFVKLNRCDYALTIAQKKENEIQIGNPRKEEETKCNSHLLEEKSRNMAVKSTTLLPNVWYDPKYFAARTAPINTKLLKRYKHRGLSVNQNNLLVTSNLTASTVPLSAEMPSNISYLSHPSISMPSTSDFMLDDGPLSFGKIESVTTLSEEQFQKGDLTFGIEQFQTQSVSATIDEMKANTSDKTVKGKMNSNISIDKIANLLNRKIRELKEKGGNVSFPSGNEESIHLLQWGVLKTLFQTRSIQLWYYNGGSKLVITSTKLRPDPSFVNLNDVSEQQYKQLPPIISDLFKSDGRKNKQFHRDIYALLHFDGKHVELVGTIFKNKNYSSDVSHAATPKNLKLIESKPDHNNDKFYTKASERKPIVDVSSLPNAEKCFILKKPEFNSLSKPSCNQICSEQGKSYLVMKSSNVNSPGLGHENSTEKQKEVSVVKSSKMNMKSLGHVNQSQSLKINPFSEMETCKESVSLGHNKINDNENLYSHYKSAINKNYQGLSEKEKSQLSVNKNGNSQRNASDKHEEKEKPLLIMKSSNLDSSPNLVGKIHEKETESSVVTSLNEQMGLQELDNQKHCKGEEELVTRNSNLNTQSSTSQIHAEKEKRTFSSKSSILNTDLPETVKQVEKSSTSVKKLCNLNLPSSSPNQTSKTSNATCTQSQLSVTKCDNKSGTRIRKLKTVWQSTKVQTVEGENVPIPLPSCAGDSRWFVLHVNVPFDVLHITSKDCSARFKHISETIKMASSHKKTVRLPLQVSSKNSVCENPNQPKFGIYAVPHISSYVFIGPYGINEDPSITKSVLCDGKYRTVIDLDDDENEPPTTNENLGQDYSEKVVNILRKLCKQPVDKQKKIHSWLYTKRNCENEISKAQKENSLPKNNAKTSSEKTNLNDNISQLKTGSSHNNIHNNDTEAYVTTSDKGANTIYKDVGEKEKERSTVMKNTESQSNVPKQENSSIIKNRVGLLKVSATGKVSQNPGLSQSREIPVKEMSPKKKTVDVFGEIAKKLNLNSEKSISYEANKNDKFNRNSKLPNSSQLSSTPNLSSSTKSLSPKKKTIASTSSASKIQVPLSPQKNCQSKKTLLLGESQKLLQPQPVAGWLVPSFLWIGCIPCNYEEGGGLFFSHPVSGVKMMFSNLESTQLWLDRLFQSAILYIPKQLFVTWTLQPTLGKDGLKQFDSCLLNGNYMMTTKGVFDIDKLVATDAESYGLKPIEVLRLQDKKCRRDLELGLYQLKRALNDNSATLLSQNSSKQDIILKAVAEIESLQNIARNLEKERKKWKNSKHKSLLYLYNKMKGLPINTKRDIVQKLKIQYDQAEDKSGSPASDVKDPNDGLNFSMARYCGGAVIFPHKSDESDLEDYLSEYDEEDLEDNCEDVTSNRKNISANNNSPRGESVNENANVETTKYTVEKNVNTKTSDDECDDVDDDESVSISVVTSQNVTEVKDIINSDEITVTCLNNSSVVKNSPCVSMSVQSRDSLMDQNENRGISNTNVRSSPKITLKPLSALTSPVKIITSEEIKNSTPYTLAVKRKLMESSYDTALDLPKKMRVHIPGETSQLNSGFDGLLLKKYKTIKIDSSVTQGNNSQTKMAATGNITENAQVITSSPKVTNPNTLYVNVVSPTQSKIVPLRVNDKVKGCVQNIGAVHVPSSTSLSNRTLKIIQKDMKPVYVQGPRRTLPVLVTSHPSTVVPTSCSMLSSNAVQPSLPVLSVKKVTKDSIPPGVEPRPATFLPPPLVPITDKKQSKLLREHTTQLLTAIAPLPTLIKMVDGMPAEKGS